MWKFHDFSVTQILREINFEVFRSAKSAISTYLEALNYEFHEFLHFLKAEIYQINKFQTKIGKKCLIRTSKFNWFHVKSGRKNFEIATL